eukprot:m.91136 g.91136  ORF g.91136 m.91136 type:complete len:376 (+) comp12324_c0_seq1:27-1154(+)
MSNFTTSLGFDGKSNGKYPKPKLADLPGDEDAVAVARGGGWKAALYKERVSRFQRVAKMLEASMVEENKQKQRRKEQLLLSQRSKREKLQKLRKQRRRRNMGVDDRGTISLALDATQNLTEEEEVDKDVRDSVDGDENDDDDDGDMLLLDSDAVFHTAGVESASHVLVAQLTAMDFGAADAEDLQMLTRLQRVQAAENRLQLEDFSFVPNLQVLELQSNLITSIGGLGDGFQHLQVLTLSHNKIPSKDIVHLACLPALKSLDLSYNLLKVFPAQFEGLEDPFPKLETLILTRNKLTGGQVFAACAGLSSLSYLALDSNHLKFIPKLIADESMPDVHPFPKLELLTINNNKMAIAKDILQCEHWPNLQEVQVMGKQ